MSKRVQYPNGFAGFASDKVADILAKRSGYKVLGPTESAPSPEKKAKKLDRNALVKEAIELGLAEKEELVKLSDSEIASLVGEAK